MLLSLSLFCYLICSLPCRRGAYFVCPSIDYKFCRKCIPELFPVYIIPNSSFSKLVACSLPARRNTLALLSNDINKLTSRQTALNSPLRARKGGRQNLHYLTESFTDRAAPAETHEMDNIVVRSWCFIWVYITSKPELQTWRSRFWSFYASIVCFLGVFASLV